MPPRDFASGRNPCGGNNVICNRMISNGRISNELNRINSHSSEFQRMKRSCINILRKMNMNVFSIMSISKVFDSYFHSLFSTGLTFVCGAQKLYSSPYILWVV